MLGLSELNYRLVEEPSRNVGRRLAEQLALRLRRTRRVTTVAGTPVFE